MKQCDRGDKQLGPEFVGPVKDQQDIVARVRIRKRSTLSFLPVFCFKVSFLPTFFIWLSFLLHLLIRLLPATIYRSFFWWVLPTIPTPQRHFRWLVSCLTCTFYMMKPFFQRSLLFFGCLAGGVASSSKTQVMYYHSAWHCISEAFSHQQYCENVKACIARCP
jgi:hypothetical protein